MTKHIARWLLASAVTWFATASPVYAEGSGVEVQMQVKTPDKSNQRTKDDAPSIEVTVIGAPNLPAEKFSLRDDSSKVAIEVKPSQKRGYAEGNETLGVAIVMNGSSLWIGNDDYTDKDFEGVRTQGALKALEAALDKQNFKDAGPAGSLGTVITYADKVVARIPTNGGMGPLANITGGALGSQADYKDTQGLELVKGIELAMAELHKAQTARKVLIVVGEGKDTNPEAAKSALANFRKQAVSEGIQTFAILFKSALELEDSPVVINSMIPAPSTVNSAESIAPAIASILARMADRQYLTFPGFDAKTGTGFVWDAKPHNLVLKIDKDETEPTQLTLAPIWSVNKGFPWLILVIVVVGFVLLIVIGIKVFGTKPAAPIPQVLAQPVVVAEQKPMGPAKTVMIGVGGDEGGFPVVGWIVPLNGAQAFQTFKLRSGGTKIGTAPPCDVVVNDGFMSTEHCQITASPQGFVLVDGGSTNGCYVNDRKIQGKQELVDNDMFTLGKTNFKFKSIN